MNRSPLFLLLTLFLPPTAHAQWLAESSIWLDPSAVAVAPLEARPALFVEPARDYRWPGLAIGFVAFWSPDSQWIAFLQRSGRDFWGDLTIRVIRPDGTGERLVFQNAERTTYARGWGPMPEGVPTGPLVWSGDSQWLAFTRTYDRGTSIWRVELPTGAIDQVTIPAR